VVFYGLTAGIAGGLSTALYLYNTTYFFGFTGPMIATTGIFVLTSPLIAYCAAPWLALRFGKPRAAMAGLSLRLLLYPVPYILLLTGLWPAIGSWFSLFIYSGFSVSLVGLDSITSAVEVTNELRFNLAAVFLPVYCGLGFPAIYILSRYRIDRVEHAANLDRLKDRKDPDSAVSRPAR
jgi:Na+/melibiose symporter-like transporter